MRLQARLSFLVKESNDPWVVWYVIDNLDDNVYSQVQNLKLEYAKALFRIYGQPATFVGKRKYLKQAETNIITQYFLKGQKQTLGNGESQQSKILDSLYREARSDGTIDLMVRMTDEEAMTRWISIEVAQRRWDKTESTLITLLEDPVPLVRQAAHQALVKLSRGNDFGPAGVNPNRDVVRAAQKQWRGWLELQDR